MREGKNSSNHIIADTANDVSLNPYNYCHKLIITAHEQLPNYDPQAPQCLGYPCNNVYDDNVALDKFGYRSQKLL